MQNLAQGRALRDGQLDLFDLRDAAFLSRCREVAAVLARAHGSVSINDVRAVLPPPPGVSPSVFGAVFRDRRFTPIGYTQATHPQAHARAVRTYALKQGEKNGQ
jgi:hypothetical protein